MIQSILYFLSIYLLGQSILKLFKLTPKSLMEALSIPFFIGMLIQHLSFWIVRSLQINNIFILAAGAISVFYLKDEIKTILSMPWREFLKTHKLALSLYILFLIFLFQYTSGVIGLWDARSIWFFQSKILYYDNGFSFPSAWQIKEYQFAHLDYPKLFGQLAAGQMKLLGFWNEYAPKTAIFLTLVAILNTVIHYTKNLSWTIIAVCYFFLPSKGYLWNGYMDGKVALFSMLAFYSLYREKKPKVNLHTFIFLSMAILTKNEGMLFFVIFIGVILGLNLFQQIGREQKRKEIALSLICLLAPISYQVIKWQYQLNNDLGLGGIESLNRLLIRLQGGGITILFEAIQTKTHLIPVTLLVIATLTFLQWRKSLRLLDTAPLLGALAYTLGLGFIYLSTPLGLEGHLGASIERTAHLPMFLMFLFVIRSLQHACSRTLKTPKIN